MRDATPGSRGFGRARHLRCVRWAYLHDWKVHHALHPLHSSDCVLGHFVRFDRHSHAL